MIATLNKGEKYDFISQKGDWLQIRLHNGEQGWVANYLVQTHMEESRGNQAGKGQITVHSLNVRNQPSLSGDIIGALQKDTSIEVLSRENNWVQVRFNGYTGWVSSDYVRETNQTEKTQETHTEVQKQTGQQDIPNAVAILHNGTNIRKSPNTLSTILTRSNQGDTFEVINSENDWYVIKLPNGQSGYVASWLVKAVDREVTQNSKPSYSAAKSSNEIEQYLQGKKIVIDPGHGGKDNGTTGYYGTLEKAVTLKTAYQLYQKLTDAGANVVLTRNNDSFISLPERVSLSHHYDADAFISIHYDSYGDQQTNGLTTFFYHPWQKELAVNIHSSLITKTNMNDRGVSFGDYYVIRENSQNAILVELGFLSNPKEELHINSDQYQVMAATGIYEGLARYFMK